MGSNIGFCIVYRFKVLSGREADFKDAWIRLTEAYKRDRGGLGSRLHQAEDGLWVAYAQWPDKQTWEDSLALGPPDKDAAELMAASVEERLEPILMTPEKDLLEIVQVKVQE
tara:strand:+ start:2550 stop:2885 length:336 start_codon:yes stop_codon:yes gene_type:complete